jgi:hypothetical protein
MPKSLIQIISAKPKIGDLKSIFSGMVKKGNLDPGKHLFPKGVKGGKSMLSSGTVPIDHEGGTVLIPTVGKDGNVMSKEDATAQFKQTGKHFGKFDSPASANNFAQAMQAKHATGGN